ncbi:MAG TPA: hypothetical protein PKW80_00155 [Bacteroidales bacterium]|nr:hypothetical protein [Bacteroidales bacterium]
MVNKQIIDRFKLFQQRTGKYPDFDITHLKFSQVQLKDIAKTPLKSGGTPKTEVPEYWASDFSLVDNKNYFGWRDINKEIFEKGIITEYSKIITKKGYDSSSTWLVPSNSILIAMASASKGLLAINSLPMCTNQNILALVIKDAFDVKYIYYSLKEIYRTLEGKKEFGNLTKGSEEQRYITIPKSIDDIYTSFKIQKILVDFFEYFNNLNKKNIERVDFILSCIENIDKIIIPHVFSKQSSACKRFNSFCEKSGIELKLEDINFEEKLIDNFTNISGGSSDYSKSYFNNSKNRGEYNVYTGSLESVPNIKPAKESDIIKEESVSFNKDNDAGSKAFYHNKPFVVGGHHYAALIKEANKTDVFIKYFYYTMKDLFNRNMFFQSKDPRANSGVIKMYKVNFPISNSKYNSIEIQKIISQFFEQYFERLTKMNQLCLHLKVLYLNHAQFIIQNTLKG